MKTKKNKKKPTRIEKAILQALRGQSKANRKIVISSNDLKDLVLKELAKSPEVSMCTLSRGITNLVAKRALKRTFKPNKNGPGLIRILEVVSEKD